MKRDFFDRFFDLDGALPGVYVKLKKNWKYPGMGFKIDKNPKKKILQKFFF